MTDQPRLRSIQLAGTSLTIGLRVEDLSIVVDMVTGRCHAPARPDRHRTRGPGPCADAGRRGLGGVLTALTQPGRVCNDRLLTRHGG